MTSGVPETNSYLTYDNSRSKNIFMLMCKRSSETPGILINDLMRETTTFPGCYRRPFPLFLRAGNLVFVARGFYRLNPLLNLHRCYEQNFRIVSFLLLAFVLAKGLPLLAQSCTPVPPGLVGWWRAEGNGQDSGPFGNHATLLSGTGFAPGMVGQGFSFNGTSNRVAVPDSSNLRPAQISVEAWVKLNSLENGVGWPPGLEYLVFKQNSREFNFEGYSLAKERRDDVERFSFALTSGDGLNPTVAVSSTVVSTGQFYHVVGTFDGSLVRLYVNGTLEASMAHTQPIDYGTNALFFGTSGSSFDGLLGGILDEISIYNRPLTDAEVLAQYQAGAAGKCCPSPAITVALSCPLTNGLPGGVLEFTGQVCNAGNVPLTNVTVFASEVLTSGTNLVASYPLLTNGECRDFSGILPIALDACTVTNIITASGTNTCPGISYASARTTNICPVATTPQLTVAKFCPDTSNAPGGFISFTGFVSNSGNVSLTNVTVTNCVSGTVNGFTCTRLLTIPWFPPGSMMPFSGTEGPIASGVTSVVNTVIASARDVCGQSVNATSTAACPVCQPPIITQTNVFPPVFLPNGIQFHASVDVVGTPPFTFQWTLGSISISTGGNPTLDILIPLDQVGAYVTNGDFSTVNVRVSNDCGFDDGSGGFSSCIVCLSRGFPVSSSTNASAAVTGFNFQTISCGGTGFNSKWIGLESLEDGWVDVSLAQSKATNCMVSVWTGYLPSVANVFCWPTIINQQVRVQFQTTSKQHYYLVITNGASVTNITYGFMPQIFGTAIRSNNQFQIRMGAGPELSYTLQASTDLTAQAPWFNLYTVFSTNGGNYLDMMTNFGRRFYRLVPGP